MYALSVKQPFASLIAVGDKTIEWRTRVWNYRGPVVICASKNPRIRLDDGKTYLPVGAAICIVDMVDCRTMTRDDLYAACCEDYEGPVDGFAWILENPREVEPAPVKGIVAPWPWKGPELVLSPGWHDRIGF
jgi:hypothetical protein